MKFGLTPPQVGPTDAVLAEVQLAESGGFGSVWGSEHHVQPTDEGAFWPATLMRMTAIAGATDRMDIGTSVLVLPLHNALEVAEQTAVLDRLSAGRVRLGVGLGYVPAEFEAYGVDLDDRAGLTVEGLRLIDRYLTSDGPISVDGRHYCLDEWQPMPSPAQSPRPELLFGGWGDLALQRAVTLCDGWVAGTAGDTGAIADRHDRLRAEADSAGREWNSIARPVMRHAVVAESRETARRLAREGLWRYVREQASDAWSHPLLDREEVLDFDRYVEDRCLVGTPADIVAGIERLESATATDEVIVGLHRVAADHETRLRSIELLVDEVLPAF